MAITVERSKKIVIAKDLDITEINPENMKLLRLYERDMAMRELSVKTQYVYKQDLLSWFKFMQTVQMGMTVVGSNEDDIEEYIFYCKEQGNNTNRIKGKEASISAFYKFLRRKKKITENPMEFIMRPKKGLPVVEQTYLTKEQYIQLKQNLKENGDLQLEAYARTSLSTMARITALSNITWEQINFDNRTIEDVLEKEGYIVTLLFDEETSEVLQALKKYREEKEIECKYVFCTFYGQKYKQADETTLRGWATKVGKLIGVNLHPHDFRHSYATLLVEEGMPIEVVSSLLNHAGLDVTRKHYIKQNSSKLQQSKDKFTI